jgi:hypothetical protein
LNITCAQFPEKSFITETPFVPLNGREGTGLIQFLI